VGKRIVEGRRGDYRSIAAVTWGPVVQEEREGLFLPGRKSTLDRHCVGAINGLVCVEEEVLRAGVEADFGLAIDHRSTAGIHDACNTVTPCGVFIGAGCAGDRVAHESVSEHGVTGLESSVGSGAWRGHEGVGRNLGAVFLVDPRRQKRRGVHECVVCQLEHCELCFFDCCQGCEIDDCTGTISSCRNNKLFHLVAGPIAVRVANRMGHAIRLLGDAGLVGEGLVPGQNNSLMRATIVGSEHFFDVTDPETFGGRVVGEYAGGKP